MAALVLILAPFTVRHLSSSPPISPPIRPVASTSPSLSPTPNTLVLPSLAPGQLPGGWTWGGGPNESGGTLVFDRGRGSMRELPYDWAIPAPTGELVYVTNQDDWAGILNLRTGGIKTLRAAGAGAWSVGMPQWSADGKHFAFTNTTPVGIELWVGETMSAKVHKLKGIMVNSTSGEPFQWLPGDKALLVQLDASDHVLLLTMHHIVSDGWSTSVLIRELGALYASLAEGRPATFPELPIQYSDFAAWQRRLLDGKGGREKYTHSCWNDGLHRSFLENPLVVANRRRCALRLRCQLRSPRSRPHPRRTGATACGGG